MLSNRRIEMGQSVKEAIAALDNVVNQVEDFLLKAIIAEATNTLRSAVNQKFVIRTTGSYPDLDYYYWYDPTGKSGAFTGNLQLATKFDTRERADTIIADRSLKNWNPEVVEA
jgi:hypothetical protein